jgi:sugar/nucleoside kinase (ribokinase family)
VRLNPEPNIELWRSRIATLVEHADLIKVSDEDLSLLYPEQDPARVIEGLVATPLPAGVPHPWRRRRYGVQPASMAVGRCQRPR